MARFPIIRQCPLAVQFWLYGLDARSGDLTRLGYRKTPAPQGSSAYTTDFLRLHSAGLSAPVQGPGMDGLEVQFERQTGRFTLNGVPIAARQGYALLWPALMRHEAALAALHGPGWREAQLAAHRLPPPVRRNVAVWRAFVQPRFGRPADR